MAAAFLAFLAAVLAGFGARDQLLVAGLAARRQLSPLLVVLGTVTAVTAGAIAAKAAAVVAPELSPSARVMFAGLAALVAGAECLFVAPIRLPAEPTRSLFAATVVLLAHQLTDGARFLVYSSEMNMMLNGWRAVRQEFPAAEPVGAKSGYM